MAINWAAVVLARGSNTAIPPLTLTKCAAAEAACGLQLRHGVPCMLGEVSGAVPIRVGKDEGKFLATIPRRHVSGAAAA